MPFLIHFCPDPCTVGHEIAGTVVALGSGVKTHKLGDRVGVGAHCWACFEPDCPACSKGMDHICPKHVNTYQGFYPDGTMTQGGYADKVRVDESHVIPIPDKVPLEHAAPLLCGGVTVYGPLKRFGAGPGKTVGIAGIGGIGHFGIMFAKAMGAHTVAISSSDSKEEDAMKLGADDYVSTAGDDFKKWFGKIDLIVITANAYDEATLGKYFMMLGLRGVAALVGAPEQPMQIGPGFLIFGEKQFGGWIGQWRFRVEFARFDRQPIFKSDLILSSPFFPFRFLISTSLPLPITQLPRLFLSFHHSRLRHRSRLRDQRNARPRRRQGHQALDPRVPAQQVQ